MCGQIGSRVCKPAWLGCPCRLGSRGPDTLGLLELKRRDKRWFWKRWGCLTSSRAPLVWRSSTWCCGRGNALGCSPASCRPRLPVAQCQWLCSRLPLPQLPLRLQGFSAGKGFFPGQPQLCRSWAGTATAVVFFGRELTVNE